ncbi:GATOR1 complex protein DEPDC5-like isoform X2 [Convolutriloba macropyga]
MNFTYAKMNAHIRALWSEERQVFSGLVHNSAVLSLVPNASSSSAQLSTRVMFRSKTAKFFVFLQMSEEMWRFDHSGNLLFENAVEGYLARLFKEWTDNKCTHELNLVIFSRTYFRATSLEDFPEKERSKITVKEQLEVPITSTSAFATFKSNQSDSSDGPNSVENQLVEALENAENDKWGAGGGDGLRYLGERTAYYRDFFQVIALGRKKNYSAVLNPLRKALGSYKDSVLPKSSLNDSPKVNKDSINAMPACFNSSADTGNVLEAINMALNIYCNHYIDRNFSTTGQSTVVISPGSGLFEVDRQLSLLTKHRMIDYGIRVDLVCLGPPPLHIRPLFKFTHSEEFFIPVGFTQVHYSPNQETSTYIPLSNIDNFALTEDEDGELDGQLQIPPLTLSPEGPEGEELELEEKGMAAHLADSSDFVNFIRDLVCYQPTSHPNERDVLHNKRTSVASLQHLTGSSSAIASPNIYPFNSPHPSFPKFGSLDEGLDIRGPTGGSGGGLRGAKMGVNAPTPLGKSTMGMAMSSTPPSYMNSALRRYPYQISTALKEKKDNLNPLKSIESQKAFQVSASSSKSRWVDCYPRPRGELADQCSSSSSTCTASPKNSSRYSRDFLGGDLTVGGGIGGLRCHSASSQVSPRVSFHLQDHRVGAGDESCSGGLLVHSNLTMSLDVRPKRVACPLSSLDGDRILLAEDNGGIGEGGGVSSICSCDTDHSVQIDWPVFVEPNCLPVTTSFRPDAQELSSDFKITYTDLDLDSLTGEGPRMAARPPLTVDELNSELVTQRVLHGYQVVTSGTSSSSSSSTSANKAATSSNVSASVSASSNNNNKQVLISTFLSKGSKSHHIVTRNRGYENDTIKSFMYTHKTEEFSAKNNDGSVPSSSSSSSGSGISQGMPQMEYKYYLKSPSFPSPHQNTAVTGNSAEKIAGMPPCGHSYLPTSVRFSLENIDLLKWSAIDSGVMDHEHCPYIFTQSGVKFWRSRFCLVPVVKKSVSASQSTTPTFKHPQQHGIDASTTTAKYSPFLYDFPRTERELLDRVDKFCRFIEYLNGLDHIRKGATNLRMSMDSNTQPPIHLTQHSSGVSLDVRSTASAASDTVSLSTTSSVDSRDQSSFLKTSASNTPNVSATSTPTPEKKTLSERSRKKSRQQTPGLELGSSVGTIGTATAGNSPHVSMSVHPLITIHSPDDIFLEFLVKSGHVATSFDFFQSSSFASLACPQSFASTTSEQQQQSANPSSDVPSVSFLSVDAVRWALKFLHRQPTQQEVMDKFQSLLDKGVIYPTVILTDYVLSDREVYRLPPNLRYLANHFSPGFLFYTINPFRGLLPAPKLSGQGERNKSILFSWNYLEMMTAWCEQNSTSNQWYRIKTKLEDLRQLNSSSSKELKSSLNWFTSIEMCKLITTPYWNSLERFISKTDIIGNDGENSGVKNSQQALDDYVVKADDSKRQLAPAMDERKILDPDLKQNELIGSASDINQVETSEERESGMTRSLETWGDMLFPVVKVACKSVDRKRWSERYEYCYCAYNALYHPLAAFQIELQWLTASGPLLANMIKELSRKAEQCQMTLVPIPLDPFAANGGDKGEGGGGGSEMNKLSPLCKPCFIKVDMTDLLPLISLSVSQDEDVMGGSGRGGEIDVSSKMRLILLQKKILECFGFVHSSCALPQGQKDLLQHDSMRRVQLTCDTMQFVHVSGSCFCSIPEYLECDLTIEQMVKDLNMRSNLCPDSQKRAKLGPSYSPTKIRVGFNYTSNLMYTRRSLTKQQEAESLAVDRLMERFVSFCQNTDGCLVDLFNRVFDGN